MNIIENIEKVMKQKGITAYKLEKDIGIKQQTFSNWKTGTKASVEKIIEIINYLGVSPNEIFEYSETEEKIPPEKKLTENEQELLKYFRKLPEREQIKEIGRIEDKAAAFTDAEKSLNSEGVS